MPLPPSLAPLVMLSVLLAATPSTSPPAAGPSSPTLAVEDTMHTAVPEVLIRAPRVTLNEILDRVARGEARRDSLMRDQTFLFSVRVLSTSLNGSKPPDLLAETVTRVYKKRPDKVRSLTLREWQKKPDKKKDDDQPVDVNFRSDMSEEIVNFAFRPENRRDFNYRIVARDLVGNHLIYRIAFQPRSSVDPLTPSGLVWVDTNDFVIVRQEVNFERSPVPLLLKGIRRMVIERVQSGPFWVLGRVLIRIELTVPLPQIGRAFDVAMRFDQYAINTGLADSLFVAAKK